jgi:3-methylcrotonyl-CoA carboxylase alpha subunit
MIAKLIAHGPDRAAALARLIRALDQVAVAGCVTNAGFLKRLLSHGAVQKGALDTGLIDREAAALCPDPAPDALDWVAAAVTALGLGAGDDNSPWGRRDGWQAWGARLAVADLIHAGAPGTVSLTRAGAGWTAATPAGDVAFALTVDGPQMHLVVDGHRHGRSAVAAGGVVTVMREAAALRFEPVAHLDPGAEAGGDAAVRAPMPGLIRAVHVAPGDSVEAGARLVTMEAMKMEHTLRAARDGVVEALPVAPGDQVEEGALLAALAEA